MFQTVDKTLDIKQVLQEIEELKSALDLLDEQTTLGQIVKRGSVPRVIKLANEVLEAKTVEYTPEYTVYDDYNDYVVLVRPPLGEEV